MIYIQLAMTMIPMLLHMFPVFCYTITEINGPHHNAGNYDYQCEGAVILKIVFSVKVNNFT